MQKVRISWSHSKFVSTPDLVRTSYALKQKVGPPNHQGSTLQALRQEVRLKN